MRHYLLADYRAHILVKRRLEAPSCPPMGLLRWAIRIVPSLWTLLTLVAWNSHLHCLNHTSRGKSSQDRFADTCQSASEFLHQH